MSVPDHPESNRIFDDHAADKLADRDTRAPLEDMPTGTFTSSNVHSALYDFGERELYVRYLRDAVDAIYRYDDVPAREWQGLLGASSKGSYINAQIAFEYRYTKLSSGSLPDGGRGLKSPTLRRFVTLG